MDPIAFSIFGLEIRWYGIFIATGVLLGTLLAIIESRKIHFDENYILDTILYCVPAAIIGARLYYVIFEWGYYKDNLMDIFAIRSGGLAIHGGIIAAVLTAIIYTKIKNISFFKIADICAPSIILGQALGRWGNFFNQEAYGDPVTREYISRFPEFIQRQMLIDGVYYHPTFLYESTWNFIVFFILIIYRKYNRKCGDVFFLYLILYSVGRFFIEGLRTDSLMLGNFRVAQLVSITLVLAGIIGMNIKKRDSYI